MEMVSRFRKDLDLLKHSSVGAVSNRTDARCPINAKIYYRMKGKRL